MRYRPTVVGPETGTLRAVYEDRHWTDGEAGGAGTGAGGAGRHRRAAAADPVFDATPDPTEFPDDVHRRGGRPADGHGPNLGELPFTVESVEVAGTNLTDFRIVSETAPTRRHRPAAGRVHGHVDFRPEEPGDRAVPCCASPTPRRVRSTWST